LNLIGCGDLLKNKMIIVSGMPATGKTRFAEWLSNEICVPLLSVDDVWEKSGAADIPFAKYWANCDDIMKTSASLIIEFGFNNEMQPMIAKMVKKYKYQAINVHFDTSFEIAHRRFNDRRRYDMGGAKPQISLEQYIKIVEHDDAKLKSSKNFRFGECVIIVDTTDFSAVSYMDIAKQIQQYTKRAE